MTVQVGEKVEIKPTFYPTGANTFANIRYFMQNGSAMVEQDGNSATIYGVNATAGIIEIIVEMQGGSYAVDTQRIQVIILLAVFAGIVAVVCFIFATTSKSPQEIIPVLVTSDSQSLEESDVVPPDITPSSKDTPVVSVSIPSSSAQLSSATPVSSEISAMIASSVSIPNVEENVDDKEKTPVEKPVSSNPVMVSSEVGKSKAVALLEEDRTPATTQENQVIDTSLSSDGHNHGDTISDENGSSATGVVTQKPGGGWTENWTGTSIGTVAHACDCSFTKMLPSKCEGGGSTDNESSGSNETCSSCSGAGENIGKKDVETSINGGSGNNKYVDGDEETIIVDVLPACNIKIEFVQPNSPCRTGTEVISTYKMSNHNSELGLNIRPKHQLTADFTAKDSRGNVLVTKRVKDVVIPKGKSNIVYFKWRAPEIPDGEAYLECKINTGYVKNSYGVNEDFYNDNAVVSTNRVQNIGVQETPDTQFEERVPSWFTKPYPSNSVQTNRFASTAIDTASFQQWEWANNWYKLGEYNVGIQVQNKLTPDEKSPSHKLMGTVFQIKLGYGISTKLKTTMTGNALSISTTIPQGASILVRFMDTVWNAVKNSK